MLRHCSPEEAAMSEQLHALERRVAELERVVVELREVLVPRQNQEGQIDMKEHMRRILEQMGIRGEPIGAEELQKMILADGADPNSTEGRRIIEEMREE